MRISIIIPFCNEERNVENVIQEIQSTHPEAEVIAVDDGSSDRTLALLQRQSDIRSIALPYRSGQSAAIYRGLMEARGDILVLIDGDGQTSISDIENLIAYIPEYDFVNGKRVARKDSWTRRTASRTANAIRRWVLHDATHDTGGSPKIMKRECLPYLLPFDGMHRFIPAMLLHAGFRTIEIPVAHNPRTQEKNKYGLWRRALRGTIDLVGMKWFLHRRFRSDLRPSETESRRPEKGSIR